MGLIRMLWLLERRLNRCVDGFFETGLGVNQQKAYAGRGLQPIRIKLRHFSRVYAVVHEQ